MPGHNLRAVELQTRLLHNRVLSPDSENGSRRDTLALRRRYRRSQLHHPRPWIPSDLPLLHHGSCSSPLAPAIDPVAASSPSDVDLVGIAAASTRAMDLVGATSPRAIDPVGASSPSAMDLVGSTSPATPTHRVGGSSTGGRARQQAAALRARQQAAGSRRARQQAAGSRRARGSRRQGSARQQAAGGRTRQPPWERRRQPH
jgi:hypothetical protein